MQDKPVFSVVVPCFNESAVLDTFHRRLSSVMAELDTWEVVYVNDGSTDDYAAGCSALRSTDPHVAVVNLSRNFGKEIATTAGLDHARGDAVMVIDADLQDPPELIPRTVAGWRAGLRHGLCPARARAPAKPGSSVPRRAVLPADAITSATVTLPPRTPAISA